MILAVKPVTGIETFNIRVDPTQTVSKLGSQIEQLSNVPFEQQRLFFNGRFLNNTKTLQDYSIKDGSTIKLVIKKNDTLNYFPIAKEKKPVVLFHVIDDPHVIKRIFVFLDIRELVAFSFTCSNVYDMINGDEAIWRDLAKSLHIGNSKSDCLLILWDDQYDLRQELAVRSDAEQVLHVALVDGYNQRNEVKCRLVQDESEVKVVIINESKSNVRLPLRRDSWIENISLLVFDAESQQYITTLKSTTKICGKEHDKVILKPQEHISTQFYIEGEEADRGIIVVACSANLMIDYLKHLATMQTNPFSFDFWREQWKGYNEIEWNGGRFISNALQFEPLDVYKHPSAILLDDDECNYTE